uniref:UDP-glycosyltransferase 91C1 n=1 Tax=Elaeis guineensis var. tenera TaxID=51953 RepID=A0A6I9S6D6_ELAGV|nr:UDP-glycosyltransferase 91C1 [Elaeis guineensis]
MTAYQHKIARYYNSKVQNKIFRVDDLVLCRAEVFQSEKHDILMEKDDIIVLYLTFDKRPAIITACDPQNSSRSPKTPIGMVEERLHIAMLPWLAFGHMIPFLHLAVALATAGLRVSFLSTPRNIQRLPKIPPHLTSLITFIQLPLPRVDGLPDQAEATVDLPTDEVPLLKIAYDLLQNSVKKFLAEESPDYVIHDFLQYWAAAAARDMGVQSIFFSVYSATTLAFFGPPEALTEDGRRKLRPTPESLTSPPDWLPSGSTVAFRRREAEVFYSAAFTMNSSGITDIDRFRLVVESCTAVAIRTCPEYEGDYLEIVRRLYRKPVIPVGLILPSPPAAGGEEGDDRWARVFRWLDSQTPKSVVFVSFGSEYKMERRELHELAHGLELANVPFLWVLRRPSWCNGSDEEALPAGFIDRTKSRGTLCFGWAPQLEILAHPSVGGSLFHSGWGSIIETLRHGHTLVVLPCMVDQSLNARLLVEKGIAVEVERQDDGSFTRDGIVKALDVAMVSGQGEELRTKTREMATLFADQELDDKYVREFVDYLLKAVDAN